MPGFYDRNQPLMLEPANEAGEEALRPIERPARKPTYFGAVALGGALFLTLFWVGAWAAFLEGYFGRKGLLLLPLPQLAFPVVEAQLRAAFGRDRVALGGVGLEDVFRVLPDHNVPVDLRKIRMEAVGIGYQALDDH